MRIWVQTDEHDESEAYLGPGEYRISGPYPDEPVALMIPATKPPAELTHDIQVVPGPPTGPLTVEVVDAANHPVADAVVDGMYPSSMWGRRFAVQKTGGQGRFQVRRTRISARASCASVPMVSSRW